jgi:formate hydrogenlyase subunit 3/multisubunit Na+/H+ antiporter MnhD subunit
MTEVLLLLTPGLPLLLALAMIVPGWRAAVIWLAPWAVLPALGLLVLGDLELKLPWLLLGSQFGSDTLSRGLLLLSAPLWLLAGIYAQSYLAHDPHKHRFFAFFLLAAAGNLGALVAQDAVSFYLFFALMSFAAYALVIHDGRTASLSAGRVYIVLVLVGETFLLGGLLLWASLVGGLEMARVLHPQDWQGHLAMVLLFLGFGVKAGVLGLHVWLPLAHPAAPTPASAVLSGAMIKLGVLGWLRFLPPGLDWGPVLIALGLAGAFYGVAAGLLQHNSKTLLAYSSISQMGLITLGVGLGLAVPELWPAAVSAVLFLVLHHGWAKGALFLSTGLKPGPSWAVKALLILPALSLAAAPLTSGSLAKTQLDALAQTTPWAEPLGLLLSLSSAATTILMVRFLALVWPQPAAKPEQSAGLMLGWLGLVAGSVALAWWPEPAILLGPEKMLAATWPLLLGIGLAWVASRLGLTRALRLPEWLTPSVPGPGQSILSRLEDQLAALLKATQSLKQTGFNQLAEPPPPPAILRFGWVMVGVVFLGLLLLQIYLLLL